MAATFPRVTSVVVDTRGVTVDTGLYLHPQFGVGGSYAAAVIPMVGVTASYGQCWRGMPIGVDPATNKLVPISASGASYVGVLTDDLTAYKFAQGVKVTFVRRGRIRSYAAAALAPNDPVKVDTSANFSGFKKWVDGTDDPILYVGRAWPLDDSGGTVAMAQGDTIFVDLNLA